MQYISGILIEIKKIFTPLDMLFSVRLCVDQTSKALVWFPHYLPPSLPHSLPPSLPALPLSVTAPLVVASSLHPSSQRSLPPEVVAEAVEKLKDAFLQYLEGNIVSLCTL